jgi:hypothetical protein
MWNKVVVACLVVPSDNHLEGSNELRKTLVHTAGTVIQMRVD